MTEKRYFFLFLSGTLAATVAVALVALTWGGVIAW